MKIILGGNGLPVQVNDVVKIVHHVLQIGAMNPQSSQSNYK